MGTDFFILMKSELSLAIILFVLIFIKVFREDMSNASLFRLVNILLLLNLIVGFLCNSKGELFGGMFRTDPVIGFEKSILNLGILLISLQSLEWSKLQKHFAEFYMLLLSTLLGMFFMMSSGNFLMFYLGLELSTIPLAALSSFDFNKMKSSEAGMKLILSSAFSSAILLFGLSILYGCTGTLEFNALAPLISSVDHLQLLAFILIFSGFAFKLSTVPFHFWTADVYEGSPVAVTAYLSVVSKASVIFILLTVLYTVFRNLGAAWYDLLAILAVISMTFGNLFALRQDNIKRLLAFSSITQAAYLLVGITEGSILGWSSVIYFILIYLCSNFALFGVVSFVSARYNKEMIADYKGFYATNPFLSWVMVLALFSLAGIPPTAGFFGKLFLLTSAATKGNTLLIIFASLNMVASLYYYLRVVKAIFIDKNENPIEKTPLPLSLYLSLGVCIAGVLMLGIFPGVFQYIYKLF